jgi:hypothetical protein
LVLKKILLFPIILCSNLVPIGLDSGTWQPSSSFSHLHTLRIAATDSIYRATDLQALRYTAGMLKLNVDVEMKDAVATGTTDGKTYGTFIDDDLRSPRTPTYVPTSPKSSNLPAFDPSRIVLPPKTTVRGIEPSDPCPPEPAKPLAWVWQCHLCQSRYPLGVTRRCLQDGHFYCSGETDRPNLKKKKIGQSCSSEFDYIGWREWGEWKRKILGILENSANAQLCVEGCERCEFPSQCQYASSRKSARRIAVEENKAEVPSASPTIDLSETFLSKNQGKNPCFCSTELITFDSIFASDTLEQSKRLQLRVAHSQIDATSGTGSPSSNTHATKSTSTLLDTVVRSAEKRARKRSALSPIAEEFLSKAGVINTPMAGRVLKCRNESVGIGCSVEDRWIDMT